MGYKPFCQLKHGGEIMHALRWTCIGVGSSPRRHVHPVSETLTSLKAKVRIFFFFFSKSEKKAALR